jgi:hypothetical protein
MRDRRREGGERGREGVRELLHITCLSLFLRAYPRVEHMKVAHHRLERAVRDKHSSLQRTFVNYIRKS